MWVLNLIKLSIHLVVQLQRNEGFNSVVFIICLIAAVVHPIGICHVFKVSRLDSKKSEIYVNSRSFLEEYSKKTKSEGLKTIGLVSLSLVCAVLMDESVAAHSPILMPTD